MSSGTNTLYHLQRYDIGVVQIDADLRVLAMNDFARKVLPVGQLEPFERSILQFHPARSQPKVQFLVEQASRPMAHAGPMAMIINIPERVLMIMVTRLSDMAGVATGYTLVFYDITEDVSPGDEADRLIEGKRRLVKIPTAVNHRIVLIDASEVQYIRAEGHYSLVHTMGGAHFCNLSIGDLEARLDPDAFLRIHRSYLVNLNHAEQIVREDGKVMLKQRHFDAALPVARDLVAHVMERLGIT